MNLIDLLWAFIVICFLGQVAVIGTGVWFIIATLFEGRTWWRKRND